ncbi:hypothetical protein [Bartonella massiliensis]|uniref:hypothetical protein n=1 Tax=Bartonella massiliensis TaxID=929795 RepID=UPI001FEC46C7|nr:hypothetical protein [Bartonella massiliensis]
MCKKHILSCTVATIVMLSSAPFNAHAGSILSATDEQKITGISGTTYEKIEAKGAA